MCQSICTNIRGGRCSLAFISMRQISSFPVEPTQTSIRPSEDIYLKISFPSLVGLECKHCVSISCLKRVTADDDCEGERLSEHGLRSAPYVIGEESSDIGSPIEFLDAVPVARLGRNAMGLTQTLPLLFETRGLKHADQHFQRRVATMVLSLSGLLEILRDGRASVQNMIQGAREDFVAGVEDITIQDWPVPVNTTFPMVSRNDGSVVNVPATLQDTTRSIPVLTRPCPAEYLIPKPWSFVAENLRILGVEVEPISTEWRGTVSTLLVTEAQRFNTTYRGTTFEDLRIPYLTAVQTENSTRDVVLPAGSFRIRTSQKNAALAFAALEPESDDSFVTYNDIPLGKGDEYPVFKVLK